MDIEPIPAEVLTAGVRLALQEDAAFDDITTLNTVAADLIGTGTFLGKSPGVVAGWQVVRAVLAELSADVELKVRVEDGEPVRRGDVLAEVTGPVRALLQGERTALNFLQRMSGTATLARQFVDTVAGTNAVILDTRKTTPGMRAFEKFAVRAGGATNHRFDLATMAMIKDNHREALALEEISLVNAVRKIRAARPVPVEIEIDSLEDLDRALEAEPEWILLDNMTPDVMAEAVKRCGGRAKLEASGGVNLASVRAIAEAGVDAISVGALTHSAPSLDISLDLHF